MIIRRALYAMLLTLLAWPVQAATPAQWLAARVAAAGAEPQSVFIASYDTMPGKTVFDTANEHTAFTYDQAMAIMALLAANDVKSARRLGDALVWAQGHDRKYHDGRLRNAYLAGPTGEGTVKLPGYWNAEAGKWFEDAYQDGAATGNNAWAGVALMRLADASGERKYAEAARGIGQYLQTLQDGRDGLPGGYERFDDAPETLTWRSVEHNTAVLALMRRLAAAYPGDGFGAVADSAQRFILSLWTGDHFLVGTAPDGVTPNQAYSGFDVQILALLALPDRTPYLAALAYAERVHGVNLDHGGGFDYSDARQGIWTEGTMEAATLYAVLGQTRQRDELLRGRLADAGQGGLYAVGAPLESLSTGLTLGNGPPKNEDSILHYYRRVHVAPTAWAVLAGTGWNPLAVP